jgi:homoserine acetyltransferase
LVPGGASNAMDRVQAVGTGKSAKPSDGLRTKFPKYNYDDMVEAQYRLVTEGLGIQCPRSTF